MRKHLENKRIIGAFEYRIFRYGLVLAVVFRFLRSVHEFIVDAPLFVLVLGIFNLLLLLFVIWLSRRSYHRTAFVIFHAMVLATSVVTWSSSGGWNGIIPYLFILLTMFVVMTSDGLVKWVTLLVYGLVLGIFFQDFEFLGSFSKLKPYSLLSMQFNFLICTVILIMFMIFLKMRFLRYQEYITHANNRLQGATGTLRQQAEQLQDQKDKLTAIRSNLEGMISTMMAESRNKAEVLAEFAFVNAHQVRGPLARVLGLIYLIELEHPASDAIDRIKTEAREMDDIVRKISEMVS